MLDNLSNDRIITFTGFQVDSFLQWMHHLSSNVISIASVVIAAFSLAVAIRAQRIQRANFRLADAISRKSGRLQMVQVANIKQGNEYRLGFTALNGPDEITITDVFLRLTYSMVKPDSVLGDWRFIGSLRATCFDLLGISGPAAPFRLAPYDEVSWGMPRYAHYLQYAVNSQHDKYDQWIELELIIVASGSKYPSNKLRIGTKKSVLGFRSTHASSDLSLVQILKDTEAEFLVEGQRWIGLNRWLLSLIKETANDYR